MTRTHHFPAVGIAAALGLFGVAASRYPGGTTDSATTLGYSWAHNFLSALFGDRALNGAPNSARGLAVLAMLALCVSLGTVFQRLSTRFRSPLHRKTIQIAGIGAMVYSFLVVTPMHNVMVDVGLLFASAAMVATTHALYLERRWTLLAWGSGCMAITALTAAMYYGHLFYGYLPITQKLAFVACIGWLLCTYYSPSLGTGAPRRSV